ncbi:MAG TPA: hypothetical protein VIX81_00405 [Gammaproteobacteria bacterium]
MNQQHPAPAEAPFTQIEYRLQGPGDYFYQVLVRADGRFCIEQGSFTSRVPQIGRLAGPRQARLAALVHGLEAQPSWSFPPLAGGFRAELSLADSVRRRHFRWAGGAADLPPALVALVNLLQRL